MSTVYLIGSMRNAQIPLLAVQLREAKFDVFEDWYSPGPEADEQWQKYEQIRGRTFHEALNGFHAKHVFAFDKYHLDRADIAVLVLPAGKSGHLELGYMVGKGKPSYILFDGEPDRYDVMYQFANESFMSPAALLAALRKNHG